MSDLLFWLMAIAIGVIIAVGLSEFTLPIPRHS